MSGSAILLPIPIADANTRKDASRLRQEPTPGPTIHRIPIIKHIIIFLCSYTTIHDRFTLSVNYFIISVTTGHARGSGYEHKLRGTML